MNAFFHTLSAVSQKADSVQLGGLIMGAESTPGYELLYDIIRRRSSIRKLKPDPIPDEYIEKILEAGRWAMSGANSQPWEYIVVKDASTKAKLWEAFQESNRDFLFWMEKQRIEELR